MNKLKNNAWFRKVGMALLDIVLILLSVYLSMELRFEMYIPTRHAQTMFSAMPLVVATLRLSKPPKLDWRKVPPLGASGFT